MSAARPADAPDAVETSFADGILTVRLNRPDALNAVNAELARGVADALMRADADDEVRAVILTAAGSRMFSAGADLKALAAGEEVVPQEPPYDAYGFGGATDRTTMKPLIGAMNGPAYGGGVEMLLQCDIIVAERGQRFALPEVQVGILAGGGGVHRLPAILPRPVAMDMLLTGEPISAERAFDLGLVSRLVEPGEALSTATAIAQRIAANAPLAVAATKALARELEGGVNDAERRAQERSDARFAVVLASEDAAEGARAFAEKRRPSWSGR